MSELPQYIYAVRSPREYVGSRCGTGLQLDANSATTEQAA